MIDSTFIGTMTIRGRPISFFGQVPMFLIFHCRQPVAHLAWKKGVCHGRAAFDITFQQKTTLSFKTRNRRI